ARLRGISGGDPHLRLLHGQQHRLAAHVGEGRIHVGGEVHRHADQEREGGGRMDLRGAALNRHSSTGTTGDRPFHKPRLYTSTTCRVLFASSTSLPRSATGRLMVWKR